NGRSRRGDGATGRFEVSLPQCRPISPSPRRPVAKSEANLEAELNVARPAGSDHGVGAGHVGRRRYLSKRIWETQVVVKQDRRVGEVRLLQNVEELGAELHADALGGFEGLNQREVPVAKAGGAEDVAPCCSETGRIRLS